MADQFNILDGGDLNYLTSDLLTTGEATMHRRVATSNTVGQATGVLRLSYFTARKTETITQVRVISGGTAAGATPTLVRIGLWTVAADGALTLVASIANDTALYAATNTPYTRALSASYGKVAGQRYAAGSLVVTGATAPSLIGGIVNFNATEAGIAPRIGAALTGQTDLPASIAAGSLVDSAQLPYIVLLP